MQVYCSKGDSTISNPFGERTTTTEIIKLDVVNDESSQYKETHEKVVAYIKDHYGVEDSKNWKQEVQDLITVYIDISIQNQYTSLTKQVYAPF